MSSQPSIFRAQSVHNYQLHVSEDRMKETKSKIPIQWSLRTMAIRSLMKDVKCRDEKEKRKSDAPSSDTKISRQREDRFLMLKARRVYEEPKEFSLISSKCLLSIYSKRMNVEVDRIVDKDRVILNEAIHAQFPLNCIARLLDIHPRATESNGIVDHIDHPIHNACRKYRAAVPLLLKANPLVASQKDAHGVYPVELFCENYNRIDISVEEYAHTIDLFLKCDPSLSRRSFWRRPSLEYELKQVLSEAHVMNCIDDEAPKEASVPYGFGLLHWN